MGSKIVNHQLKPLDGSNIGATLWYSNSWKYYCSIGYTNIFNWECIVFVKIAYEMTRVYTPCFIRLHVPGSSVFLASVFLAKVLASWGTMYSPIEKKSHLLNHQTGGVMFFPARKEVTSNRKAGKRNNITLTRWCLNPLHNIVYFVF